MVSSQVIPQDRLVSWDNAGLRDTITTGFTWLNVVSEGFDNAGIAANDLIMDSLISVYGSSGAVFFFPQGNYLFNNTIDLQSNQILKGEGMDQTLLSFDLGGSGDAIRVTGSIDNSSSPMLSVNAFKGQNYIQSNASNEVSTGEWIKLFQQDDDLVTSSWAINSVGQIVKIVGVAGDTIFLESALRMDFEIQKDPKFKKMQMKSNVGIECLKLLRLDDAAPEQASNFAFRYASNCWLKNVESENCTFSHVVAENASNLKIGRSYFHHGFDYGGGGRAYGVSLQFTTNECLIEDNIFEHLRHSMLLQAGPNGNVFAYNFSTDPYWTSSSPFIPIDAAGDMVLHGNYPYANLFEQNSGQNIVIDNSHGANGPHNTFLRNRASLFGIFFSDATSPSQNLVGNEIPNTSSPYSLVNYNIQGADQFEYGNNNKGNITPNGTEVLGDESYFYTDTPVFLNATEWSGIGTPNVMEQNTIPAQTRFETNAIYDYPCEEEEPVLHTTNEDLSNFSLYPNPTSDQLIIESDRKGTVFIYDVKGSLVVELQVESGINKLNVISFPIGIYRVVLLNVKKEIVQQKSFVVD
ncbi:MAG: glycosyl hydrolase family 28-related protein [Crocinitomicaceae bacterium]|nr:glycosyl hydrolase family 28-related protein [Crocinitomicaceae bacterium]